MFIILFIDLLLDALSDGRTAAHLAISERCVNTMTHIWKTLYYYFNPTGGPRGCAQSTTRQRAQLTHSRRVTTAHHDALALPNLPDADVPVHNLQKILFLFWLRGHDYMRTATNMLALMAAVLSAGDRGGPTLFSDCLYGPFPRLCGSFPRMPGGTIDLGLLALYRRPALLVPGYADLDRRAPLHDHGDTLVGSYPPTRAIQALGGRRHFRRSLAAYGRHLVLRA